MQFLKKRTQNIFKKKTSYQMQVIIFHKQSFLQNMKTMKQYMQFVKRSSNSALLDEITNTQQLGKCHNYSKEKLFSYDLRESFAPVKVWKLMCMEC